MTEACAKLKVGQLVLKLGGESSQGAGVSTSALASFSALQSATLDSNTLYSLPGDDIPATTDETALDTQSNS